jgi:hypothetical protein
VCHRGDDERRQDCCQPCRPHDQLQSYPIFLQVCYSRLSWDRGRWRSLRIEANEEMKNGATAGSLFIQGR